MYGISRVVVCGRSRTVRGWVGVVVRPQEEDLDLEAGTLQVRRTLSEPKGGWIFEAPKSGKGRSVGLARKAI